MVAFLNARARFQDGVLSTNHFKRHQIFKLGMRSHSSGLFSQKMQHIVLEFYKVEVGSTPAGGPHSCICVSETLLTAGSLLMQSKVH